MSRIRDIVSEIEIKAMVIRDMNEQLNQDQWLDRDIRIISDLCKQINATVLEARDKIENIKTNL